MAVGNWCFCTSQLFVRFDPWIGLELRAAPTEEYSKAQLSVTSRELSRLTEEDRLYTSSSSIGLDQCTYSHICEGGEWGRGRCWGVLNVSAVLWVTILQEVPDIHSLEHAVLQVLA